ncbi:MAG: diaminopimelate decarboxylase [Oscillospiraceae bacterium]|nr:diaminopimelate decarboxylase [Oscillospiraceae bacterium]
MNKRFEVSSEGHLMLGGCDAVELTKTYGTPLYVMDEQKVRDAMRAYRSSMEKYYGGNGLICYASKAFACKEMYRIANEEGLGVDVVSGGELYTALSVGFPAEKIGFHGNNKLPAEIRMALENDVGRIIVDGLGELELVDRIAGDLGVTANIILRITPGVDAHTHDFIRTGQIDSKFGLALETGAAMEGVKAALKAKNICLKGLDCHIGSQIMDVEPFVHTGEIMMQFILDIKNETGVEMEELDLGGGFGIRYVGSDDPVPYDSYMEAVSEGIKAFADKHGLKTPFIFMEPGRSIVGEAGTTLYTVGAIKEIPGVRTYVSIDGGMSDNPRYALYQAKYDFLLAEKADAPADSIVTVAGKCCESGDLLGEHVKMPMPKTGDILAVLSTGAYNYSMASNYNRNPIPPVVMVRDGASRVIVKGQTYEDMARFDV